MVRVSRFWQVYLGPNLLIGLNYVNGRVLQPTLFQVEFVILVLFLDLNVHSEKKSIWAPRKVRLTQKYNNINRANEQMITGDGGLAKHNTACEKVIDWNNAIIIGRKT